MFHTCAWTAGIPLLGFFTGARSMTPTAVVCWFAYLGRLHERGTWGFWSGMLASVIVFTVFALGEYIGDKLPKTPNRTDLFALGARIGFGGLVGALCATGLAHSLVTGTLLGTAGAFAGTFLTFHARRFLVKQKGLPDLPVALVEDLIVLAGSVLTLALMTSPVR